MVSKNKLSRKELKRPDKFKQKGLEIIQTVFAQKAMVSIIFIGTALVVFAIVGYKYIQDKKLAELENALASINQIYQEELKGQNVGGGVGIGPAVVGGNAPGPEADVVMDMHLDFEDIGLPALSQSPLQGKQ